MPFSEAEQRHYDTLLRQGYSPEDARMITAFSRDRGQTPEGLPKPKPTFDYKADLQARLAGPYGLAEGARDLGKGILEAMGQAGTTALMPTEPLPQRALKPKATEAIAQAMGPAAEEAPAPAPEAATRAMPKLPPMLERPIRPLSESDSPEVKESMRRRLFWLKDAMAEPASPTQGLKRDEVEELRNRLRMTEGLRGIGEGLTRAGDITSDSQILLGVDKDPDPTHYDDRDREARMRGRLGELEAKREQDALPENDPSSDLSQFIRGELGKLGFEFPESVSAAQVKQYFPGVYEPFRDRYEDMLGAMKGEAQADAESTKAIAQERTRFLGNRTLSEAIDALQQADTVETLIDSEPLAVAASIVKMARLSGEKGQLSNRDVEAWRRRLGFQGTWDKFVEYVTSEPSEGYKQQLLAVAKEMREKLRQSVRGQAKREAKTFLKVHAGKVPYSEKDVDRFIDDVYLGGDFQSKVRLRHRQTGEVREFDPALAQQIMAQGLADPIDEPGVNPHYTRRELGEG